MSDIKKSKADDIEKPPRQTMGHRYLNESGHTRKRSFDRMNEDEVVLTPSRPTKRAFDISETDFNSYGL